MSKCPIREPARFLTRRDFLSLSAGAGAAAALSGCVTNPVTGKSQFSLVSENEEIRIDKQNSPHQFSADYGPLRLPGVNAYVESVGQSVAAVSHRPNMPYSFRAVNASNVNAYAFPGGSIATTRGIMLEMDNEAQLAALMGHEVGHVCARHTAQRMTSALVAQLALAGAAIAIEDKQKAAVIVGLGNVGAGLLLARYSRADERQADALGMEYMVKAGTNPQGMAGLMEILVRGNKSKPNALQMMFSSHPMSQERYDTAVQRARTAYAEGAGLPANRERYMDETAPVRAQANAVAAIQKGDAAMMADKVKEAEGQYAAALKAIPDDYEALLKMSSCLLKQNRSAEAQSFARKARQAYPEEPQALHVEGFAALSAGKPDVAHQCFSEYGRRLPGNPSTSFFNGLALEGMGRRNDAAAMYAQYIQAVQQGQEAEHAAQRLVEWGFVKPAPKQ